jgi:hypothetical protein
MNAFRRRKLLISQKLRSPQQEWQKDVIIQPPNSMAAGRFKHVADLHFPHGVHVLVEDLSYELFQLILFAKSQPDQTPAEKHIRKFVACSVIDSNI